MLPVLKTSSESMCARSVDLMGRLVAAAMAATRISMAERQRQAPRDLLAGQAGCLVPDALAEELRGGVDLQNVCRPNGLLDELRKALVERVLIAEMERELAAHSASQICFVGDAAAVAAGSPPSPRN